MSISELRRNPITKRWVVIATSRGKRHAESERCPFCPGNEGETEKTILAYPPSPGGEWQARVFPNKFLAFAIEGELEKRKDGIFRSMNGRGAHEVITARAHKTMYELLPHEIANLLFAARERMIDLRKAVDEHGMPKLECIAIFGNEGPAAGASKSHAHWQLIGLPIIPHEWQDEYRNCEEHWDNENECLFCRLTAEERERGTRIIAENEYYLSLCDGTGRFPFETWILPVRHMPLFEHADDRTIAALADMIGDTLARIGKALAYPAFNLYFHNAPMYDRTRDRYYHSHIKIVPRLTQPAGFELGTGFFINPMAPEEAARILRTL